MGDSINLREHFFEPNPDGGTPEYCICGRHESDSLHVGMLRPFRATASQDTPARGGA